MDWLRLTAILVVAALSSSALSGQCSATPQSGGRSQLDMAGCLAAGGKLDLASKQIRQYRKTHPQAVDGAVAEAQLLLLENYLSDAGEVLNRILLVHPRSVEALTLDAELARRTNDSEKTERLLILCTKVAPEDAETWKRLGNFYLRKQPTNAVTSFTHALNLHPDDALALAGRASAEADTQSAADAARDFARAISLNRNSARPDAMVDWLYAEFLSSQGRKRESLTAYDRAIGQDASLIEAYLGRAKAEMALQEWTRAAADLERIAPDQKYAITALALLVKVYKGQGNLDKAREVSKQLERVSAEDDATRSMGHEIAYRLETAAGLIREGNCDKAIQIDQALLEAHPEVASAQLQSGQCYFQLDRLGEAETALRAYLEHYRDSAEAHSLLGRTLLRAGKTDTAREQFSAARLIDPLMIEASLGLAACSIQQQKYEDAEKILRAVLAFPDASTQAHLMLAECLYKQNRRQPAMEEISRALAMDPSDKDALRMKSALAAKVQP